MRTPQHPLPSGFGHSTTAEQALGGADLSGKRAVITGGYAGIGLEAARVLHAAGASIIVPARDVAKAQAALAGWDRVEIHPLDLADPASIDAFGQAFDTTIPLDLFIANAGIMAIPLTRDARGYEMQFATNHLGHFHLASYLWPALKAAGDARVVVLSSGAHRFADVDLGDPNFEHRDYEKWQAYGQAKTANALFAIGLDQRGEPHRVRAFAVHPGSILTELTRSIPLADMQAIGFRDADGNVPADRAHTYKTVPQGAATTVWCAANPQLAGQGGVYCEDCDIAVPVEPGTPGLSGVMPWAIDPARADRLWTLSERLIGHPFAI